VTSGGGFDCCTSWEKRVKGKGGENSRVFRKNWKLFGDLLIKTVTGGLGPNAHALGVVGAHPLFYNIVNKPIWFSRDWKLAATRVLGWLLRLVGETRAQADRRLQGRRALEGTSGAGK